MPTATLSLILEASEHFRIGQFAIVIGPQEPLFVVSFASTAKLLAYEIWLCAVTWQACCTRHWQLRCDGCWPMKMQIVNTLLCKSDFEATSRSRGTAEACGRG